MFSPLDQFEIINFSILGKLPSLFVFVWTNIQSILAIPPFFNILLPLMIFIVVFFFLQSLLKINLRLIPQNIQCIFEASVIFIFDLIKQQIGYMGYVYIPIFFTVFNLILILNLLSLVPFGIALTSHIIIIMWLSLSISLAIFIIGLVTYNIHFLKIFMPECPLFLLPLLMVIEIFSYIIRAFSLAIRLSANIMAGHTLVFIISSSLLKVLKLNFIMFSFGLIILILILCLELGVAFLQAYVFTVLCCIYLNDSINLSVH